MHKISGCIWNIDEVDFKTIEIEASYNAGFSVLLSKKFKFLKSVFRIILIFKCQLFKYICRKSL